MKRQGWECSEITLPLRNQINEYVNRVIEGDIPHIPFEGYLKFRDNGSRKESESDYFNVRKQLTALGLYLQWKSPSEKEKWYFNELLWSVSNEFTWCLAAHLSYGKQGFLNEPEKNIDLFAAETAATLGELLFLQKEHIDPYIQKHIREQIDTRIFVPFLNKDWSWETSRSNWCAVCAGSVGMTAILLERGERQQRILDKVERALENYLNSFGEDGATEEGVGYWAYGFGYYVYYTAMKQEFGIQCYLPEEILLKVRKIAEFPRFVQITENSYVPFSDTGSGTVVPTGLLSYLQEQYSVTSPTCSEITPFDFDHCYRFAHISRNLWWTDKKLFSRSDMSFTHFFYDKQWLIQKDGPFFVAAKGGNNAEEHNHNDVGSFLCAVGGELILTDLGAGPYTADYFGAKRYQHIHTRSYWHNLPMIQGKEQIPTPKQCEVKEVSIDGYASNITMELSLLYDIPELISFKRSLSSDIAKGCIVLKDEFIAAKSLIVEEGFISMVKPTKSENGIISWEGKSGRVVLQYDTSQLGDSIEVSEVENHLNEKGKVYRVGLRTKELSEKISITMKFVLNI